MLTQPSGPAYYARLQFKDADSCVAWLESLPLARIADAHEMVAAQVGLVARAPLPMLERMRLLEILFQTAKHLQDELALRFVGRALPLSIVEYSIWNTVMALWHSLYEGYRSCLREFVRGDGPVSTHAPLLALRCIELTGAAIREHHRVYRAVPQGLWMQLHDSYANAERHGLAALAVTDPLRLMALPRTCAGAYAQVLLAHLSNPYTMSPRQMDVMYRWAEHWEALVQISIPPIAPAITPVLALDLRAGAPPESAQRIEPATAVRYLGMEQLGHTLRRVLSLLRQGHDPATLGLGEDCRQPGCERLLTLLYIQWCGSGMGQLNTPTDRGDDARASVGFQTVARQLASEAEVFRSIGATVRTAYGPLTEHWNIVGLNAPGFISAARGPECESRIEHHQLVAIKRRSASSFQLAVAQWLKQDEQGDLSIGLRMLPGIPSLSTVSSPMQSGEDGVAGNEAIVLPAAPEMRVPASLILRPGVFTARRELELLAGTLRRVRLLRLLERGVDFERAAFEPAS